MTALQVSRPLSDTPPATVDIGAGRPELKVGSRSVEQLLALRRIGVVMTPERNRPEEAWGVLNPASARSRQGDLYLFPRVVAEGNYSRIAIAKVRFDDADNPVGVERMGLVMEPQERYETAGPKSGGVEDPRITYVPLLDLYVMTYVALGEHGPRICLATSEDLFSWKRLGLLQFAQIDGVDFNRCDNKDCVLFPLPVEDPEGRSALAFLHRPNYLVMNSHGVAEWLTPPGVTDRRPSIWISYVAVDRARADIQGLTQLDGHQLLAQPIGNWEHHHIGSGAPPILSEEGWLLYYHGVVGMSPGGLQTTPARLEYRSGVMLLDRHDPRRVLNRSFRPVLKPRLRNEQHGIVPNVVFPTAVDVRGSRIDVYYGAADERIAAATTSMAASVLMAPSAPPETRGVHQVGSPRLPSRDEHEESSHVAVPHAGAAASPVRSDHRKRRYAHILVCLDGSLLSEQVLHGVEPLVEKFGSRVTLLQVIQPTQVPTMDGTQRRTRNGNRRAAETAHATNQAHVDTLRYLATIRRRLQADGLEVDIECAEGAASEVILRRAFEMDVDLIAIATHGRTGLDRMLLGSVAEEVVRRAPCPVLLERVLARH
jgi:beta-1,2-mannobiose phosphorylase / 1,2-beta-oligomannan phosphorylase